MKEVKKKLEERIKVLERELKSELPKALMKAIELGDLKENAEYQTAKERQAMVQTQLGLLRQRLANLSLVNLSKIPTDRVSYGSEVVLVDLETDQERAFRLVTSEESDAANGLISTSSPIGKSLMGHKEGDEETIRTPRSVRTFEILSLKTIHDKN